jgi:Bacterial Ig domain
VQILQTALRTQFRRPRFFLAVAVVVAATLGLLSLPLFPSPAHAATATFKQVNAKEIRSGTVNSLAFDSPNTAGNLIVVYLAWTNENAVSVEDTNGNVYSSVDLERTPWGPTSDRSSQVFYAKNIAGGANTVRATFATAITSRGWADMYIHEYSGIDKVNPLDVSHVGTGMAAAMTSGPATTTNANDLIFGAGASAGIVNQAGTDFTSRSSRFGNRTEDRNVTAAGPYETTATQDGDVNPWVMHMVAFKVDASAPDTTPPSTPTSLRQTPRSPEQIDLNWNASADDVSVTGYKVFRNGIQIAAPATPSYSDTGLAPLTTYSYTVSATDAAGNVSPKSAILTATTLAPPPDTSLPTVSLTAPADGATVAGTINVTATASDNVGIAGVQFLLDGNPIKTEDTTAPYSVSWNTSTATNGAHVLTARARDAANNRATSAPTKVTVDTTGPTVTITSPTNNAKVVDIVNVTADASDNIGVAGVQFLVDGVDRGPAVATAPYVLAWDSRTMSNGTHTLGARVRDAAGNPTLSAPITVNVANDTSRCGSTAGTTPTATILEPNAATGVVAGQVISFRGEGTDPDCGPLPASAFSWRFERVNDVQTVLINSITGVKNGSLTIPASDSSGVQVNTRYRITLDVINQQGQKATSFVDIYPMKVKLTFNTAPPGLTLYVDGVARITPFSLDTLVGSRHNVEARNQTSGGLSYTFTSWSDEKAQQHEILVSTSDQTYTATYAVVPAEAVPIAFKQQNFSTATNNQRAVSTTYTNAQTAGNTNIVAIGWRSDEGEISKVTDDRGNAYELAAPLTRGEGNLSQAIYYAKNIVAGPAGNTVKVTFSGARLGPDVRIAEYSGLDPTNPVDVTTSSSGSNNNATSGSVTTTAANTMLFAAGISWSNYGNATNEFTTRVLTQPKMGGLASTGTGIVADRIASTIGTYEATAPVSGGGTWLMQLVAFRGLS